jgi:hypothetical protein
MLNKQIVNVNKTLISKITHSLADIASASLNSDFPLIIIGYGFMFVYTMFMLGKPNFVEQRCFLSIAGVSAIAMGIVISIGLTMAFGFPFTTIHGIMPLLALGKKKCILTDQSNYNRDKFQVSELMTCLSLYNVSTISTNNKGTPSAFLTELPPP